MPVPALLPTCERLTALFDRHGYADGVIFGHAKDGNVHFMLTERLRAGALDRFSRFTEDMVELILDQGGSLKAEHGTGRMMAPFVRRQYGDELYAAMQEIKRLCDPRDCSTPGVVLTDDPDAHLRDLKPVPGRGRGRPVRGVRVLRAGLPQPRPHHHPAAADRAAPGAAARQGRRRRGARRRARGRVRLRRHRHLRGRRHVPDRLPRPDQHRRPGQAAAAGAGGPGPRAGRPRLRALGGPTRAAAVALDVAAVLPDPLVAGRRAGPQGDRPGRPARVVDRTCPRGGSRRTGPSPETPDAVLFASCTGTMFGPAADGPGARPRSPRCASGRRSL